MKTSNCCGASPQGFIGPGDTVDSDSMDFGICPKCGEHCDFEELSSEDEDDDEEVGE